MFCFFTLKIENTKGEVFELTHNTKDYVVAGIQGLTRPPTSVNTSACAGIDGSFFNSARMEQRNIVLDLILRGDIEGNRQRLYHIFPAKTPCTVYFKNYNRDVKIKGYVETLEGDIFSVREQMQISIICPKPFWEDMQAVYDELSSIVKRFSFPFSIEEPIPIAELNGSGGVTIENKGDVETGFICRVTMQTKKIPTLTRNTYSDPLPEEQSACSPWLERQIALIRPKMIVCLGRIAAMRYIREDFKISREHGQWTVKNGIMTMAIMHPAALLRDPRRRPEAFEDLKVLQQALQALLGKWQKDPDRKKEIQVLPALQGHQR